MRSIQRSFNKLRSKQKNLSDFICFERIIHGKNFSRDRIKRMFNALVDKSEYAQGEKRTLLKGLYQLTKHS
ncbi:MAG: hypothetical protein RLZZ517_459 [Candidatus Parcubacteria bacterium]|jgi:hypothetical protein